MEDAPELVSQLAFEDREGVPFVELTVTEKLPELAGTDFVLGVTVRVCALCITPKTLVTVPDLMVTVASLSAPVVLLVAVKVNVLPLLV